MLLAEGHRSRLEWMKMAFAVLLHYGLLTSGELLRQTYHLEHVLGSALLGITTLTGCNFACSDVLLEVPLSLCLTDYYESGNEERRLDGVAPTWTSTLPWNVQLAANILSRRGDPKWDPFFSSWPSAPVLPYDCEPDELLIAGDRVVEQEADEACFWLHEQYWALRSAAEEHGVDVDAALRISPDAFKQTMALVWSRCLRLSAGEYGVRRLLVPMLDLANHEPIPSAVFAFASGASCGPSIRLHAARAIMPGDAVRKHIPPARLERVWT